MPNRPNILVLCSRNKQRSRTAEYLFKNDSRFQTRSAGTGAQSNRKVTATDLTWADLVLVMEHKHVHHLREKFGRDIPPVEVLHIPDIYPYMHPDLVDILNKLINDVLHKQFML